MILQFVNCNQDTFLENLFLEKKRETSVLAFSGGADSTALFYLLVASGIKFTAVHFNHGIRENASKDAEFCKELCKSAGIPFVLEVWNDLTPGAGFEEAARQKRINFFLTNFPKAEIFLAHHQDDVLENAFIKMLRGANISGVTGLRDETEMEQLLFRRPLINYSKAQILDYLTSSGKAWCEDESNTDTGYRRNFIRHEILPMLEKEAGSLSGLKASLKQLGKDADYIEKEALKIVHESGMTSKSLNVDEALLPRVLKQMMKQAIGKELSLSGDTYERIKEEISFPRDKHYSIPLGQGVDLLVKSDGGLVFEVHDFDTSWQSEWNEDELLTPSGRFFKGASMCSEKFAPSYLTQLNVRFWQPGDRMIPFGRTSQKKVKDLFNDAGIPVEDRKRVPLLCNGEEIIWIPGVRRANFGLVNDDSQVVEISYERF